MTVIELRQKLINQIDRLSFEKLLVLEKLIQDLEINLPDTSNNINSVISVTSYQLSVFPLLSRVISCYLVPRFYLGTFPSGST